VDAARDLLKAELQAMKSGQMLPSVRTLVQDREVSDATVKHALSAPRDEGLIISYGGARALRRLRSALAPDFCQRASICGANVTSSGVYRSEYRRHNLDFQRFFCPKWASWPATGGLGLAAWHVTPGT
jgi:DNA-binding transcriptional MocR family regulator